MLTSVTRRFKKAARSCISPRSLNTKSAQNESENTNNIPSGLMDVNSNRLMDEGLNEESQTGRNGLKIDLLL